MDKRKRAGSQRKQGFSGQSADRLAQKLNNQTTKGMLPQGSIPFRIRQRRSFGAVLFIRRRTPAFSFFRLPETAYRAKHTDAREAVSPNLQRAAGLLLRYRGRLSRARIPPLPKQQKFPGGKKLLDGFTAEMAQRAARDANAKELLAGSFMQRANLWLMFIA